MSLTDEFQAAQARIKTVAEAPSNEDLLRLYALYKQGTAGDVTGKRPGMMDFKGRAKYDAWATVKGLPETEAQKQYVALVDELAAQLG